VNLLMALVAAACAAAVAWVFVISWRDQDLLVATALGVAFLSLAVVAIVFLRAAL
jgi:hypothetical protein